jgi:hypothetical protein
MDQAEKLDLRYVESHRMRTKPRFVMNPQQTYFLASDGDVTFITNSTVEGARLSYQDRVDTFQFVGRLVLAATKK